MLRRGRRKLSSFQIGSLGVILALGIFIPTLAGAQDPPQGGTIVDAADFSSTENVTWLQLDTADHFSADGGYGVIDPGGTYEQVMRYLSKSGNTLMDVRVAGTPASRETYLGLFVQPVTDNPCQPDGSAADCTAWFVEEAPDAPPDTTTALAALQSYEEPESRQPDEAVPSTLSVRSQDLFVTNDLGYYLLEIATGVNSLQGPRTVFTTYEVDPNELDPTGPVWRPITGLDAAPDSDGFAYAELTLPEPVTGCHIVIANVGQICVPDVGPAVSVQWIGFAGVPEEIDRLEYLAGDGSWQLLIENVTSEGILAMPSSAASPLQVRLGQF